MKTVYELTIRNATLPTETPDISAEHYEILISNVAKGDKGLKGDKGDKGEKGDRGDTSLVVQGHKLIFKETSSASVSGHKLII